MEEFDGFLLEVKPCAFVPPRLKNVIQVVCLLPSLRQWQNKEKWHKKDRQAEFLIARSY